MKLGRYNISLSRNGQPTRDAALSFQQYIDMVTSFVFNGSQYVTGGNTTLGGSSEEVESSFTGYCRGLYKSNGVIFACMAARALLFSEARFQFRAQRSGRPGKLFGDTSLRILEKPGGPKSSRTTGDLLSRMLTDVDVAGNSFVARRGNRLVRLRPDWTSILLGADDPNVKPGDVDADLLGYVYYPGGREQGKDRREFFLPDEVAHFAPITDPEADYRGMSWLTPIIREAQADLAATTHKLQFFENGATPNLLVKLDLSDKEVFDEWVETFRDKYEGMPNAYRTMFLAAGADATVVGADLKQIEFKATQGHGETRIAAAARIPPIIVGLSEGLEAATYSNYGQARRAFADATLRPLWRNAAGSLSTFIKVPSDAELWYDDRDIPFLQEDVKDAAEVMQAQAITLKALTDAGYTKDSAVNAVVAGDFSLLEDTGLTSVQLFPPGEGPAAPSTNGSDPAAVQNGAAEGDQTGG